MEKNGGIGERRRLFGLAYLLVDIHDAETANSSRAVYNCMEKVSVSHITRFEAASRFYSCLTRNSSLNLRPDCKCYDGILLLCLTSEGAAAVYTSSLSLSSVPILIDFTHTRSY